MTVRPKTTPRPYQADELAAHGRDEAWGVFWEPGLGKSKLLIDTFADLEDVREVSGLAILAPNGVHYNWVRKELPAHLPDELAARAEILLWDTKKAKNIGFQNRARAVLEHDGPALLSMSYHSLMTDAGQKYMKAFLQRRRCIQCLDESHWVKTPGRKRTIRVTASGKYSPWRRILTGTLVADSPFDVFTQLRYLKEDVWHAIGCRTAEAFKATFGVWDKGYGRDREYPVLVNYRNLELLHEIVDSMGSRLLAEDAGLELPNKVYPKRYFDLTPEQLRAYEELRREFSTFLAGTYIDAPLAITRILRLQQVTSGYLPTEDPDSDDVVMTPIGGHNPRIETLMEVVRERHTVQGIVWAKYRQDLTLISQRLQDEGITFARYDGQTKDPENQLERFWGGDAQLFLSNPAKGGEGLTLNEAKYAVFYNNSHKLLHRKQAEKRNDRIGQDIDELELIDILGRNTVDELIVKTLRSKNRWAAIVQGDELREWI